MPQLRLIHVLVQPVFMLDDGDGKPLRHIIANMPDGSQRNLTTDHPISPIAAQEWPTFATERFPLEVANWQAQLDAEAAANEKAPPRPPRRRAARKSG